MSRRRNADATEDVSIDDVPPTEPPPPGDPTDPPPPDAPPADAAPEAPKLPEVIPPEGPTIEEHAAELEVHPATLAAVKAYFRFGQGRKMSREHFELVLAHVENLKFQ